jgi:hypothetical protein
MRLASRLIWRFEIRRKQFFCQLAKCSLNFLSFKEFLLRRLKKLILWQIIMGSPLNNNVPEGLSVHWGHTNAQAGVDCPENKLHSTYRDLQQKLAEEASLKVSNQVSEVKYICAQHVILSSNTTDLINLKLISSNIFSCTSSQRKKTRGVNWLLQ